MCRRKKKVNYVNKAACADCAIRSLHQRRVSLGVTAGERGCAGPRANAAAGAPEILATRRETVEHPFGSIKQWMNQGAFLTRGLENVRGEFSLTALAYNLRRVTSTWLGSPS
jgi:hypothetical protein